MYFSNHQFCLTLRMLCFSSNFCRSCCAFFSSKSQGVPVSSSSETALDAHENHTKRMKKVG